MKPDHLTWPYISEVPIYMYQNHGYTFHELDEETKSNSVRVVCQYACAYLNGKYTEVRVVKHPNGLYCIQTKLGNSPWSQVTEWLRKDEALKQAYSYSVTHLKFKGKY